ncbi:hypothetical protein Bsel_2002 [[Bacillus] selenitireducens MLS10]|uniref:Uncharacterized protein n=1 Tax=Bacillus selenitireducens (strain ATCC 700615 / DSM 15326 / MLS10) TaxID=439292 RepID=D6XUM0_BACIE|nr:hypothetical protein Bsel_2002 [[Bacillus] selenitireducens MLS10]
MKRSFAVILIVLLIINAGRHLFILNQEGFIIPSVLLLLLSVAGAGYLFQTEVSNRKEM